MKQFETLRFLSDEEGQADKNASLTYLTAKGWRVLSETIEQGHVKGGEACCLASICLPLGFAAGRTPNVTMVSIERDLSEARRTPHEHQWRGFDHNRVICLACDEIADRRHKPRASLADDESDHEHHWVQHASFKDTQYCDVANCRVQRRI